MDMSRTVLEAWRKGRTCRHRHPPTDTRNRGDSTFSPRSRVALSEPRSEKVRKMKNNDLFDPYLPLARKNHFFHSQRD